VSGTASIAILVIIQGKHYLHAQIRITHTSVHSEFSKFVTRILLHGTQNGLSLEACRLESGTGDVAALRIGSDPV
jgi:hypothetical protein